jgi:hypothetical protein
MSYSKAFKDTPKLGFLLGKYTIWQPWDQAGRPDALDDFFN